MGFFLDILDFFTSPYTTKCCGTCIHYQKDEDGYLLGKCNLCSSYVGFDDEACVSYILRL